MEKRWRIFRPDEAKQDRLARELAVPLPLAGVLMARGLSERKEASEFLKPSVGQIEDFQALPDSEKAIKRLHEAIREKETITIYADYDADGLTAAAIVARLLKHCGYSFETESAATPAVRFHVPHRISDGYGVHTDAVERIARSGTRLLICVDCGINAPEAIRRATSLGMDTVVLDHHEPGDELPAAAAIVDPKLMGSLAESTELTGAGLALKFALALVQRLFPRSKRSERMTRFIRDAFALATVGTIADVAPLVGENRTIVSFGLDVLGGATVAGLEALRKVSSIESGSPNSYDVAFRLAPRINAASRVGSPLKALELLLTDCPETATSIARELDRHNRSRQREQRAAVKEALAMVENAAESPAITVWKSGWNPGIIGLVASKLVDRFYRPSIVITVADGIGRGSARSIPGVNIHDVIKRSDDLLVEFGGHACAAGLVIAEENIERFASQVCESVAERMPLSEMEPTLEIDAELVLSMVDRELLDQLKRLEPYGEGNSEPLFAAHRVGMAGVRSMGRSGDHVCFEAVQGKRSLRAVAFGFGELYDELFRAERCSIAFVPFHSDWSGQIELRVKDVRIEENR